MDDADVKARDLRYDLQMHCAGMLDDESIAVIAAAIRDAEQRGMRREQDRVSDWVRASFGDGAMHRQERAMRVLEEAIELAQAEEIADEDVQRLSAHVYAKPPGSPDQEVGGIGVCLLAWAGRLSSLPISTPTTSAIAARSA